MAYIDELLHPAISNGDSDEERRIFAELAEQGNHPTGMNLATEVMRGLVSLGQKPEVSPILKAVRDCETRQLIVDPDDAFNQTFLSSLQLTEKCDPTSSRLLYLGGCTMSLVEITRVDDYSQAEFDRLNPVPLPALRVVIEPQDI